MQTCYNLRNIPYFNFQELVVVMHLKISKKVEPMKEGDCWCVPLYNIATIAASMYFIYICIHPKD